MQFYAIQYASNAAKYKGKHIQKGYKSRRFKTLPRGGVGWVGALG